MDRSSHKEIKTLSRTSRRIAPQVWKKVLERAGIIPRKILVWVFHSAHGFALPYNISMTCRAHKIIEDFCSRVGCRVHEVDWCSGVCKKIPAGATVERMGLQHGDVIEAVA